MYNFLIYLQYITSPRKSTFRTSALYGLKTKKGYKSIKTFTKYKFITTNTIFYKVVSNHDKYVYSL